MGQVIRQDTAISSPVMHALLQELEGEWSIARHPGEQQKLASLGAYACIAFCGSFRGLEVSLTDMAGLIKFFHQPTDPTLPPHVVIPLLGRFKKEVGARYHLTPLTSKTSSGIDVHLWVSHFVMVRTQAHYLQGSAFCDSRSNVAIASDYEIDLLDR
jgi:hypothetical protein